MQYVTKNFISPNFGQEKLDSATYEDLVDVFEDRMQNWFLRPVERLLEMPHCQTAAVSLLISYFEGITIYFTGKDSKNKSFKFFAEGFSKVFSIKYGDENASSVIARAIYDQVRCGFAHDGLFRDRVSLSDVPSKPIIVSFPKNDGGLDLSQVESIVINPSELYKSIRIHFEQYMNNLRDGSDETMKERFEAAVKLKWALDEPDRVIGMSEEEFFEA